MELKLLRYLSQAPRQISQISGEFALSTLETLNLIAILNHTQPGLIINQNGYYRVSRNLNYLQTTQLNQLLNQAGLAYVVHLSDKLESTNGYALNHIEQLLPHTIISCEWQTAGRGRFGRKWLSTLATDLTLSLVYHFPLTVDLAVIPLVIAVALNRLLKNYGLANQIKWPNDIYSQGTKIAGILVENIIRNQINHTVIGIGYDNIYKWERNQLLADLIINVEHTLREFDLFGFALLRQEWLDNCLHLKKNLTILQNGQIIAAGIHQDINEHGELVLQTATTVHTFASSSISVLIDS